MPTRPDSPDPSGTAGAAANPFATLGEGLGKGLDFFQDWMKAAGSALPHVSAAATPGASAMPGWSLPTLDPAELDKRIQELRTVQFWLEQNARMIAMTIQGLEVQRMTLSTLQGMNVSMDQLKEALKVKPESMQDLFNKANPFGAAAAAAPAASQTEPPAAATSTTAPVEPPAPAAPAQPASSWFEGVPDEPTDEGSPASDDTAQAETPSASSQAAAEAADLINPMRWWDTLTQQFSHLTTQAANAATATAPGHAQAAAPDNATAPRTRKRASPGSKAPAQPVPAKKARASKPRAPAKRPNKGPA